MAFSNEDFGMSMGTLPEHKLSQVPQEPKTPEDAIVLPCHVRFSEDGMWFTINQTRDVITKIMNGWGDYILERMKIHEYCPFQMEGDECSIMYIYNVPNKEWRLE